MGDLIPAVRVYAISASSSEIAVVDANSESSPFAELVSIIEGGHFSLAARPVIADIHSLRIVDIAAAASEVVGAGINNSWRDSSKKSKGKTLVIVSLV